MVSGQLNSSAFILVSATFFLILTGCASSSSIHKTPTSESESRTEQYVVPERPDAVEQHIRNEVVRWRGTPYRYGGTGRDGIDCSAFVMLVYEQVFGYKLPRTTLDQVRVGEPVSRNALKAGDLVFFHPASKSRHVGIYLNNDIFAHASTTEGVTESDLNDPYWRQSYWTARRIVNFSPAIQMVEIEPENVKLEPELPTRKPLRVGW